MCPPKKRPLTKWTKEATSDLHSIERLWKRFPEAIPAIVTGEDGGFTVIDLDVKNGKDWVTAHKALGLDLDDAGAVVETASGGIHLYFDYFEGVGNSVDKLAPGIDIRGDGGYVLAPGAVGEIGRYEVLEGDWEAARLISGKLPEQFRPEEQNQPEFAQLFNPVNPDAVRSALFYIPNYLNYEDWVHILMAVHHAFDGAVEGLKLAQEWCLGVRWIRSCRSEENEEHFLMWAVARP